MRPRHQWSRFFSSLGHCPVVYGDVVVNQQGDHYDVSVVAMRTLLIFLVFSLYGKYQIYNTASVYHFLSRTTEICRFVFMYILLIFTRLSCINKYQIPYSMVANVGSEFRVCWRSWMTAQGKSPTLYHSLDGCLLLDQQYAIEEVSVSSIYRTTCPFLSFPVLNSSPRSENALPITHYQPKE